MYTFVLYFIMYSEFVINIDVLKLSDVSDYFKHFVIRLDKKSRFYMTDVIVDVPSTISPSDLEAFLEVVSEKKILLMPLLEILDPYTIFVLADYFGVIQTFREIHFLSYKKFGMCSQISSVNDRDVGERSPRDRIILLYIYGVIQHT